MKKIKLKELLSEKKNKGLWANIHAKRKRGESPAKPGDKDYPKTLDIDEDYSNSKWEVYVGDDAYGKNRKVVKVAKSKRAATILYNKLIKTDKYFEVGMRAVKEGKLSEGILTEIQSMKEFYKYFDKFYGPKGLYPNKKGKLKLSDINKAVAVYIAKNPNHEFYGDSLDREKVRDVLIKQKKLVPTYNKNEGKINERMDRRKAAEILKQIGGNRFIAMTGAKGFAFSDKYMSFKIGRNSKGINFVRIGHNAKDLYDMEFGFVSTRGIKVKKKVKGVYADMLGTMFKKYTGMNVRL